MPSTPNKTDVLIIGGGLAGIVTALELLDSNYRITLVERGDSSLFGGLAKESFGGIFLVKTREQRWSGVSDSTELALNDWLRAAEFGAEDGIPREWAKYYIDSCKERIGDYLHQHSVHFFPVVHWVEKEGNSVPRFHMVWGTGYPGHHRVKHQWPTLQDELRLVREGLPFLSAAEQDRILGGTAAEIWNLA